MQSNRYLPAEATPASVGLMGKERFLPLLKSSDYELQSLKWLTLPHSNKRTPVQSQLNFLLNSLLFFHPPSLLQLGHCTLLPLPCLLQVYLSSFVSLCKCPQAYLLYIQVRLLPRSATWQAAIQKPFLVTTPWPRCLHVNTLSISFAISLQSPNQNETR